MDVDTVALYRGSLDEFVLRRTALVKALRKTDPAGALAVGKLRKPSVGVWGIDQLAVDDPALIAELLAAGADAREAQLAVAADTAAGEDLVLASARLRDAVEAAVRAAAEALVGAGHAATDETARRTRTTLQAAATGGAEQRLALWRGTLDRDMEPAGFGVPGEAADDSAELAAALVPLRRRTWRDGPARGRTRDPVAPGARRAAERAAAELQTAAGRARVIAESKRQQAARLAEQARVAEEDASAAERAAEDAEDAARVARDTS